MKQFMLFACLFSCAANFSFSQPGIKIHVEYLKSPDSMLKEENYRGALTAIVRQTNQVHTPKYITRFDTITRTTEPRYLQVKLNRKKQNG